MSRSIAGLFPSAPWRKQALLFLLSQNLSLFGSSVAGFALVWHITLRTQSGLWMMLATVACNVPQLLVLLWGGVWADRHDRRFLIMGSDAFVALITLGLAIALAAGGQSLWLMLGALALRSLGGGVQAPASAAMYPQLVPPEYLNRVQGINQTANAALMLLAPAVGGVLLELTNLAWALLLDVATAGLAVAVMFRIKAQHAPARNAGGSALAEMRRGLLYTFRHRQLRLLVLCYGAFFFLVTPAAVLSPLMIARSFGDEVWRLAVNELAWAVMSIAGGVYITWRGEFADKPLAIGTCVACFGLCCLLMGLAGNFAVFLCLMGLAGFFVPVFSTTSTVFIQQNADPAMLGRVFSVVQIISGCGMPAAIVLFGPLADKVSVESLMLVTGALTALTGLQYIRSGRRAAARPGP